MNTKQTVTCPDTGDVQGWVRLGGCQNPACHRAERQGRPWHAVPRRHQLGDYHFATQEEAVQAIRTAQASA